MYSFMFEILQTRFSSFALKSCRMIPVEPFLQCLARKRRKFRAQGLPRHALPVGILLAIRFWYVDMLHVDIEPCPMCNVDVVLSMGVMLGFLELWFFFAAARCIGSYEIMQMVEETGGSILNWSILLLQVFACLCSWRYVAFAILGAWPPPSCGPCNGNVSASCAVQLRRQFFWTHWVFWGHRPSSVVSRACSDATSANLLGC